MKKAYAVITKNEDGQYQIDIEVTNGELTSGADGWTETAETAEDANRTAEDMLLDYCEDGQEENGGIVDRS